MESGHDAAILNEIGDAVGDDPGLAAARAGEDEHRPVRGFDGFALLRIEFFEKRQMWNGSGVHCLNFTGDRRFGEGSVPALTRP